MKFAKTLLIGSLFCSISAVAQTTTTVAAKIDSLLEMYASYDALNGNVLIAQNDSILYKRSFGYANYEWQIPHTPDTRFGIASISKLFTAVIILQLNEKKALDLHATLSSYLDDWKDKKAGNVTIEQLLLHTSGLTDTRFIPGFDDLYGQQHLSTAAFFELFADSSLLFESGTAWSYSNFGYNVLAAVAEKVSGKSYRQLLKENIFLPAGMLNSTTFQETHALSRMAYPYETRFGDVWKGKYADASTIVGSGDIITTTGDYFQFMKAVKNGKLLNKQSFHLLSQPYTSLSGEKTGYALWFDPFVAKRDTLTILRGAGTLYGWNSVSYTIPENGYQLILFLNISNPRMFEIADKLTELVHNLPIEYPKDTYAHVLFKEAPKRGIDQAIEYVQSLKSQNHCLTHPRHFNRLGYHYLENGNTDWALKVFLLNIGWYPNDANLFDSLGEVYMVRGENVKAIENYRLSLSMDPSNDNAARMLQLLESK